MPQGTITKLVHDRGFGFISTSGQDLFFHHSCVVDGGFDQLQEGQNVEFEIEEDDASRKRGKGPRASHVRPV